MVTKAPLLKLQRVVGKKVRCFRKSFQGALVMCFFGERLSMKNIKIYVRSVCFLSMALIALMTGLFMQNWLSDILPGVGGIFSVSRALGLMSFWQRLVGMLVDGLFVGLLVGALYYCIKLMRRFEIGDILSPVTIALLQRITGFLFWWAVYTPIRQTLQVLIKTLNNPVGQRVLSVSVSSNDIFVILICLLLHIITSIMQEACKIKAEQDLVI